MAPAATACSSLRDILGSSDRGVRQVECHQDPMPVGPVARLEYAVEDLGQRRGVAAAGWRLGEAGIAFQLRTLDRAAECTPHLFLAHDGELHPASVACLIQVGNAAAGTCARRSRRQEAADKRCLGMHRRWPTVRWQEASWTPACRGQCVHGREARSGCPRAIPWPTAGRRRQAARMPAADLRSAHCRECRVRAKKPLELNPIWSLSGPLSPYPEKEA